MNARFLDEYTSLHYCAKLNRPEVAIKLMDYGANINAKSSMNRSPLILAVLANNYDMVKLLLDYNADVNV